MNEKIEISPIERKVAGLLQRIKLFRSIEVRPQELMLEHVTREYVKHRCHNSFCFAEGEFLNECSHEERCDCDDMNTVRKVFIKYRLDFLVISGGRHFCIECDGREWHVDKDADAERDKWLLAKGIPTLRVPGEYIHAATDRALLDKLTNFLFGQKLGQKIIECEAVRSKNKSLLTPKGGLMKW